MKLNISGFLGDIKNFFHGGKVLGIDIGTAAIKVIEVSKKGDRFQLLNYGLLQTKAYLEHPNQAIQTSSLKLPPRRSPFKGASTLCEIILTVG